MSVTTKLVAGCVKKLCNICPAKLYSNHENVGHWIELPGTGYWSLNAFPKFIPF